MDNRHPLQVSTTPAAPSVIIHKTHLLSPEEYVVKKKELGERQKLQAERDEMRDRKHPAVGKRRKHHQVHVALTIAFIAPP